VIAATERGGRAGRTGVGPPVPPPRSQGDGPGGPMPAETAQGEGQQPTQITPLEARHIIALTAIAIGLTGRAAARRLDISDRTLRRLTADATARLGAHTPIHAVALAAAHGLLPIECLQQGTLPEGSAAALHAPAEQTRGIDLRVVADLYRAHPGHAVQTVAAHFHLTKTEANAQIRKARDAGLLPDHNDFDHLREAGLDVDGAAARLSIGPITAGVWEAQRRQRQEQINNQTRTNP
jgi:DNA-binding CsgD family transcriptional regulator